MTIAVPRREVEGGAHRSIVSQAVLAQRVLAGGAG